MSPERKSSHEQFPNLPQQILILLLLLGFSTREFSKFQEFFLGSRTIEPEKTSITHLNIEKFPPGFLKDEVIELKPENIGQYVAVNRLANIPNDQINMKDRKIVKIRTIYKRQTIKGFVQFFEGAEVLTNLDGSFYQGEPSVYITSQILYFLKREDTEKINK